MIEHGAPVTKLETRAERRRYVALGAAHRADEVDPLRKIGGDRRRQRASETMRAATGNAGRTQLDEFAAVEKKVDRLRAPLRGQADMAALDQHRARARP